MLLHIFTYSGLINNMGNYIIFLILIITSILVILFRFKDYPKIKILVNEKFKEINESNLENKNNDNSNIEKLCDNRENVKNLEIINDNNNGEEISKDIVMIKNNKRYMHNTMNTNGEITDKTNRKLESKNQNTIIDVKNIKNTKNNDSPNNNNACYKKNFNK